MWLFLFVEMADEPSDACSRTDGGGVRAGRNKKRKSSRACSYPNKKDGLVLRNARERYVISFFAVVVFMLIYIFTKYDDEESDEEDGEEPRGGRGRRRGRRRRRRRWHMLSSLRLLWTAL